MAQDSSTPRVHVFLSYRRVNNQLRGAYPGLVTEFADALRTEIWSIVGVPNTAVFMDTDPETMIGGPSWREKILRQLQSTTVFVSIMTALYLDDADGHACSWEFEEYLKLYDIDPWRRSMIALQLCDPDVARAKLSKPPWSAITRQEVIDYKECHKAWRGGPGDIAWGNLVGKVADACVAFSKRAQDAGTEQQTIRKITLPGDAKPTASSREAPLPSSSKKPFTSTTRTSVQSSTPNATSQKRTSPHEGESGGTLLTIDEIRNVRFPSPKSPNEDGYRASAVDKLLDDVETFLSHDSTAADWLVMRDRVVQARFPMRQSPYEDGYRASAVDNFLDQLVEYFEFGRDPLAVSHDQSAAESAITNNGTMNSSSESDDTDDRKNEVDRLRREAVELRKEAELLVTSTKQLLDANKSLIPLHVAGPVRVAIEKAQEALKSDSTTRISIALEELNQRAQAMVEAIQAGAKISGH